ncbi:MAG: hypothetical protein M3350_11485 [Actinomycetota bacterium]|nr:hypothetical protein [Actinomycetota bacterium]MDQ3721382.1 hypothetical protein [Actinomycetota bacterium]
MRVAPSAPAPDDELKLFIKGFNPDAALTVAVTGPGGRARRSSARADALVNAEPQIGPAAQAGRLTVVVTNDATGASARTSLDVKGGSGSSGESSGRPEAPPGKPEQPSGRPEPPSGTPPGGEASDLPECGPGIPKPCRQGGKVVK